MCELLRKIAAQGLVGPIPVVLDLSACNAQAGNARSQRNDVVQALADELGIPLLFLPSYSPNLHLIERLWKFIQRNRLDGRYYATFQEFRTRIDSCPGELSTVHRLALQSLMTLNLQTFHDVTLLTA